MTGDGDDVELAVPVVDENLLGRLRLLRLTFDSGKFEEGVGDGFEGSGSTFMMREHPARLRSASAAMTVQTRSWPTGRVRSHKCRLFAHDGQYQRPLPDRRASSNALAREDSPGSWCQPAFRNFGVAVPITVTGSSLFAHNSALAVRQASQTTRTWVASTRSRGTPILYA